MKVLVGLFSTESNANVPFKNHIDSYKISYGDTLIENIKCGDVFREEGIGIIPSFGAGSGPSGVIERDAFDYIESQFVKSVKTNLGEFDGIYLMFHGASEVEGLGSGDHYIVKKIREIVGPYLPIAITCDPHGNLSREYVEESATIIRTYRHSPHTDIVETCKTVAKMLCDLLKNRRNIHSVYRKLPMILGGEQSVSTDEPVKSINRYMDELEQDSRIMSCSWHVGYIRHDTPVAGCGIVVIPQTEADQDYASQTADRLAAFVWERRHEFHYTGLTERPDRALNLALGQPQGPSVITDSGDNVTSGASGWNTFILRQVLALPKLEKSVLFASICDPKSYRILKTVEVGGEVSISLGTGYDEMSKSVDLDVVVKAKGDIVNPIATGSAGNVIAGHCVTVSVKEKPIDIIVADSRQGYYLNEQFCMAGVDWTGYDITVVKLGYIWPELKSRASFYVMSLTDGSTLQDTRLIPFKRIMRPMYPIDNI